MGCTPTKPRASYTQDKVCRDLDTCSTWISGLKSSVSTPERPTPGPCPGRAGTKQNFLNVPTRDYHGRSLSRTISPDGWSSQCSHSETRSGTKPSISDSDSSDTESPQRHQQ